MTLDEIISALKSSDLAPSAVLTAGVAEVEALAPIVYAVAEQLSRGAYLLPGDNRLLFHGLNILAAARHPQLLSRLLAMARQPEEDLQQLFPITLRPA